MKSQNDVGFEFWIHKEETNQKPNYITVKRTGLFKRQNENILKRLQISCPRECIHQLELHVLR